jgi:hypothetical protein
MKIKSNQIFYLLMTGHDLQDYLNMMIYHNKLHKLATRIAKLFSARRL